jgi:DNA-binding transcriptional regulator YdaS (Cro superfamily)
MLDEITSVAEVVDVLGGPHAASRLLGTSPQVISNWKRRRSLPPDRYLVMLAALNARGLTAPPSLWGIAEPNEAA